MAECRTRRRRRGDYVVVLVQVRQNVITRVKDPINHVETQRIGSTDRGEVWAPACVSLRAGIKGLVGDKLMIAASSGIRPVIPGRSNRKKRIRHDKEAYKGRNLIERRYLSPQGLQARR
jgi:hypothetical protein